MIYDAAKNREVEASWCNGEVLWLVERENGDVSTFVMSAEEFERLKVGLENE